MVIIEFFGPPCSGKTSNAKFLLKRNKNFISSTILIPKYSKYFINLSALDKVSLKYLQLIKFLKKINPPTKDQLKTLKKNKIILSNIKKNKYTNLMIDQYRKICKRLYKLYCKKNKRLNKFYLKKLDKIKDKKLKLNYQNWFEENMARYHIANNLKDKKRIVIFDEGLLQRSFFMCYQKNSFQNSTNIFLKYVERPDYAIYLDDKLKTLYRRSKLRQNLKKNSFVYKDLNQIKKYKVYFKYLQIRLNQI